jgi:hypothetical protein
MSSRADTPIEKPRKTLDDIRRELDEEAWASGQALPGESDWRVTDDEPLPAGDDDRRSIQVDGQSSWLRRFLIVALIGAIATEVVIIADVVIARYDRLRAIGRTATDQVAKVEPPAPAPPPAVAEPSASAMALTPAAPAPTAVESPPPTASVPDENAPYVPADHPRLVEPTPPPARPATPPVRPAPAPPRTATPSSRPTIALVPTPPSGAGPEDWLRAQGDLRAALKHWLEISGRDDAGAQAAQAVVILGPDGRTAKTEVLDAVRGRTVVREQRWQLLPTGWTLVYERDIRPGEP